MLLRKIIQLRLEIFDGHARDSGTSLGRITKVTNIVIHHYSQIQWMLHELIPLILKSTITRWLRSEYSRTTSGGMQFPSQRAVTSSHWLSSVRASMRRALPASQESVSEIPVFVVTRISPSDERLRRK